MTDRQRALDLAKRILNHCPACSPRDLDDDDPNVRKVAYWLQYDTAGQAAARRYARSKAQGGG